MGFRVHASPKEQITQLIQDSLWDDICVPLLGQNYDWNMVSTGRELSTAGVKYLFNEIQLAKHNYDNPDLKIDEEDYAYFIDFLTQTIENNNVLKFY